MQDPHVVPSPASPLRLRTLGAAALHAADRHTPVLGPGKPLALLAYLDALPGRRASREHLDALLWADREPLAARHALRQTIWYLRKRLGDHAFASEGDDVVLTIPIASDRSAFLGAVEAGRHHEAVAIYQGEFLPRLAVAGGSAFEHWADAERQRLRLLFQRAGESLAREALHCGDVKSARDFARRVRDADPLDERGWRLLIEICLAQGDRVSALAEGQRLQQLLASEHRPPEPATGELLRRAEVLPDATADRPDEGGLVAELVGREREFATLLSAFDRAKRGGARVALLVADAGLGKTRLLRDLSGRITAAGGRAVYVRAHPGDRDVPWAFLAELVRLLAEAPGAAGVASAAAATLVALDPALSNRYATPADPSTGEEARRRRLGAVAEQVRAVSDERPLALLLDDLHWSDAESRDALEHLPVRVRAARVLLTFATRPAGKPRRLEPDDALSLARLDEQHVDTLLASLGALPDEPWAESFAARLGRACDGSPLLILETLHLALDTGILSLDDGAWTCTVPERLDELLAAGSALTRRIQQPDRAQRWLLLLLAVAGSPLPLGVLTSAAGHDGDRVLDDLTTLEKRGLIARLGGEWAAAHDEIAARVEEAATPAQVRATHAALGRALLAAPREPATLRFAARHLVAAELHRDIARCAKLWVRQSRAADDRRRTRALVADLLGLAPDDGRVRRATASLPWATRMGGGRTLGVAAAGVALLLLAVIAPLARTASRGPGIVVTAWLQDPAGGWRLHEHEVTEGDLDAGVINLASFRPTGFVVPDRPEGVVRPGAPGTMATTVTYPDSGGLEVALVEAGNAHLTRLTFQPGDDYARAWSPDGRYLAIATDRWTNTSRTDLAILDPEHPDSIIVRVTNSDRDRDETPLWSPDGTRLAFYRASPEDPPRRMCVVAVNGSNLRCLSVPGYESLRPTAWASPVELVGAYQDSVGVIRLLAVHTETGAYREIAEGATIRQTHAPGWVTCFCRRNAAEPFQVMAVPATRPDRGVRLELGDPPPNFDLFTTGSARGYLDRLTILTGPDPVPVDGAYRLELQGRDATGAPVRPLAVGWSVSDTTIGTIDGEGTIHPRREGVLIVVATAGGWRTDSVPITIGPAEAATLVEEYWTEGIRTRWTTFGEPRPFILDVEGRRALAPNGDSAFQSGVYLRSPLPTGRGLGVEIETSTPRTQLHWQNIYIKLVSADSTQTASWDHERGDVSRPGGWWRECVAHYPQGESEAGRHQMSLGAGISRVVRVPPEMAEGRWTRIRIQYFPDGRCGFALDGKPLAILDRHVPLGDSAMLLIHGASHRTRFLIGNVEVWSGVRRDVEWGAVNGASGAR